MPTLVAAVAILIVGALTFGRTGRKLPRRRKRARDVKPGLWHRLFRRGKPADGSAP